MAQTKTSQLAFNHGETSRRALARVDIEKMRLAAETQENFAPFVVGPMTLRPGTGYITNSASNLTARFIEFIFANDDTALLECTASVLRPIVSDAVITRPSVSTAVTSGTFNSSSGWDTSDTSSGNTTTIGFGHLTMMAPARGGVCRAKQTLTVSGGDVGAKHALRIIVRTGPVSFRAGSTVNGDDYIEESDLGTGYHSLAFTPTGTSVFIQFESRLARPVDVTSIAVESAGTMTLPSPWGASSLDDIRYVQSGDVIFNACQDVRQMKIERRGTDSWSIVDYVAEDGPFAPTATLERCSLAPSVHFGSGTLTASRAFFTSQHVGALFRLFSTGQSRRTVIGGENAFTDPIRITGVGTNSRAFNWVAEGTWAGTLQLQATYEDPPDGGWFDATGGTASKTTNGSSTFDDHGDNDNKIVNYRVGFKVGQYTSGNATVSFNSRGAEQGAAAGICRVTGFNSNTSVTIDIIKDFSSLTPTYDWNEGEWSTKKGFPSAVEMFDGRLFWFGRDRYWGSESDNFTGFDIDTEGDSGPINKSLGAGPIDRVLGALALSRLLVFREGVETTIRSSSVDEPLTPTASTARPCSTQGSANVRPIRVDTTAIFVQRSTRRVYDLNYSLDKSDYVPTDMTRLNDEIGETGFVDAAVARQPDTAIYFVRGDGQVAVLTYDKPDQVVCWTRIVAANDGVIEAVAVLPGSLEDSVYFCVKRIVNGSTVRFIEKMARFDQCRGDPGARLSDAHVVYSGVSTTAMTGGTHLIGEEVVAWGYNTGDETGVDLGTFTVDSSGHITLGSAVTNCCWGLPYDGKFKSAKLAYGAQQGTALNTKKKIDGVGLLMLDVHKDGIQFGTDFDNLRPLPLTEDGAVTDDDKVWPDFDKPLIMFDGSWDTDSRLCLKASSPRPVTVSGVVMKIQTNE